MAHDRDFEQTTEQQAEQLRSEAAFARADAWARSTDGRTYTEMFPQEGTSDERTQQA